MTLRGLAALGVLAIAGCKQPIINVYPAACATPVLAPDIENGDAPIIGQVGAWDGKAWIGPVGGGGGGGLPSVITSTPVASLTPWDGSPREANGGEEWVSNGWGHWEKDDNGEARPPLATPTPMPEVVAGCPSSIKIDGHETPFDARMSEDEPYCTYDEKFGPAQRLYYYAWIPRGKQ